MGVELFQKINLRNRNCEVNRSTILFIDEIDTVCPNREFSDQVQ
jgi:ATP-dependent 26S proteasome regulatory subunit